MNNQTPQEKTNPVVPNSTTVGMPTDQSHIIPNNSIPPSPPAPPKAPNMFLLLAAAVLFLGILGTGSYVAYKNYKISTQPIKTSTSPTPTPLPSATPDPTANWKTYTNSVGKYSFKYDPGMATIKNSATGVTLDLSGNKISVSTEPTKLNLNAYVDQNSKCKSISSKTGVAYTLDSILSLRFDKIPCGTTGSTDIYSVNNGIAYHITVGTQQNFDTVEPIFNQILSTFKFALQTVDITNWKTYTDTTNHFSVRYPPEMKVNKATDGSVSLLLIGPGQVSGTELGNGVSLGFSFNDFGSSTIKEITDKDFSSASSSGAYDSVTQPQTVTIAGLNGYSYSAKSYTEFFVIYLPANNGKYVRIDKSTPDPKNIGYAAIADQILSTLKFSQ